MRNQFALKATLLLFFIGLNYTPTVSSTPLFSHQKEDAILLNGVCTSSDQLEYAGYEVWRNYDNNAKRSRVTIKKQGKVLAEHNDGKGIAMKEASCFGLYPILGGKTKQLFVVQTSGGAHCCYRYRIYDLRPRFRLLFDSKEYPIGDGFDKLEFNDLDRDGVYEFTQRDMTFHYWEDMSYVSSPEPEVVFQYNPRVKKFLPASKKFSAYLLKDIAKDVKNLNRHDPHHWVKSLDFTLRYIFAGKEELGWKFYDKQFGIKPGGRDRMKTKIKNALKGDALYRFIYRR